MRVVETDDMVEARVVIIERNKNGLPRRKKPDHDLEEAGYTRESSLKCYASPVEIIVCEKWVVEEGMRERRWEARYHAIGGAQGEHNTGV